MPSCLNLDFFTWNHDAYNQYVTPMQARLCSIWASWSLFWYLSSSEPSVLSLGSCKRQLKWRYEQFRCTEHIWFQVPVKEFVIESQGHDKRSLLLLCNKYFMEIAKNAVLSPWSKVGCPPWMYIMGSVQGKGTAGNNFGDPECVFYS